MQHLCFFLSNKSNPFMIPHATQLPKILFPSDPEIAIPSKSVTKKADEAAVFRVLRENRLHFSAESFHVSHFLCEMLKFCCLFLLILFGIL